MKQIFLNNNGSDSLLIFFGGWGSGPELFAGCIPCRNSEATEGCISLIGSGFSAGKGAASDILFCYDYRSLDFDWSLLAPYSRISVMAWSMGVWVADHILGPHLSKAPALSSASHATLTTSSAPVSPAVPAGHLTHVVPPAPVSPATPATSSAPVSPVVPAGHLTHVVPPTPVSPAGSSLAVLGDCIAIGGTLAPIDDNYGIPTAIFNGTLDNLSDLTLQKFRRRMCGKDLGYFNSHLPERSTGELRDELAALRTFILDSSSPKSASSPATSPVPCPASSANTHLPWTHAVIGTRDMIFPADNQLRAWQTFGTSLKVLYPETSSPGISFPEVPSTIASSPEASIWQNVEVVVRDVCHFDIELFTRIISGIWTRNW